MIIIVKKRQVLCGMGALLVGLITMLCIRSVPTRTVLAPYQGRACIVLDAGHGGEDGGAVSADGVAESGINLAIVQRMELLLTFLGTDTRLTRSGEGAVYSSDAKTLRQKKVSDLKNRVALVNETENAILVSIHQNSMPGHPKVHGAQVFYNTVSPAEGMAQTVQETLNGAVNSRNEKAAKAMDSSIYLMKEIKRPGILVECGFLSNAAETELLQSGKYQMKLALAIVSGCLRSDGASAAE